MIKAVVSDFFPLNAERTRNVILEWRVSPEYDAALNGTDQEFKELYLEWLTNYFGVRVVSETEHDEPVFYFLFESEEQMLMFKLGLGKYES